MEGLTSKLEYIHSWLQNINTDCSKDDFELFTPGLSQQEIDSLTKDLPFQLPDEILELYQWRNGVSEIYHRLSNLDFDLFFFPEQLQSGVPIEFLSLQQSLELHKIQCQESQLISDPSFDFEYWNIHWLPIGAFEYKKIFYVDCQKSPSPICQWSDSSTGLERVYNNLTSFISVIKECCETEIYTIVPRKSGKREKMTIRVDNTKLNTERAIFQKYNS
jgi:cell wall assembly regulator SMI1